MNLKSIAINTLALLALTMQPQVGYSQVYPERAVKVIQGFAPGGNADNIARSVGLEMAKELNQSFVVEAMTGAGGTIASGAVARSKADGYTLLLATGGHAVAGALFETLPYKTVADFEMVSTITFFPFLIVTNASSKFDTLNALLSVAKTSKDGVTYGTAGIGSTHHLAGELLAKTAKANLLHIPFRGDAASITALLANEVDFIVVSPTAVMPNIKAGKLRALATTGVQRWIGMPELPTVAEQGVAGYEVRSWAGFMAPAGTPKQVISTLNKEVNKALQVPSVRKRLEEMGGEAKGSTPDEMRLMVSSELKKWTQVVTDSKIPKL